MNIFSAISKLNPMIEKDVIIKDIELTRKTLTNDVLPMYNKLLGEDVDNLLKDINKNAVINGFTRRYGKSNSKPSDIIKSIIKDLAFMKDNLDDIETMVNDILSSKIYTKNLDMKRASLIIASDSISFTVSFSMIILNYLMDVSLGREVNKSTFKFINTNYSNYAVLLTSYGRVKITKLIKKLPEVVVDKDNQLLQNHINAPAMSSLSSISSGFNGSPIYHLRLLYTDWFIHVYKVRKERKRLLELKVLYLKSRQDDSIDKDKLRKQIEYYEERIADLEYKLHKMEESSK